MTRTSAAFFSRLATLMFASRRLQDGALACKPVVQASAASEHRAGRGSRVQQLGGLRITERNRLV